MKVQFSAVVGDARGSTGGNVFSRNKGGAYVRKRVSPTNPQTPAQQSQRSRISDLASLWSSTLTQAQRDGWAAFGVSFPVTDKLGQVVELTGLQSYTRLNARLLAGGLTRIDTAPGEQAVTDLTSITLTVDVGLGNMEVAFLPTPLGGSDRLQIEASPGVSPGINNATNRLRLIVTSGASVASPLDFEAAYVARFGAVPIVGTKVFVRVRTLRPENGAIDSPLVASTIVVST